MGVTAPIPVTATRLRSVTLFLQKYFDVCTSTCRTFASWLTAVS